MTLYPMRPSTIAVDTSSRQVRTLAIAHTANSWPLWPWRQGRHHGRLCVYKRRHRKAVRSDHGHKKQRSECGRPTLVVVADSVAAEDAPRARAVHAQRVRNQDDGDRREQCTCDLQRRARFLRLCMSSSSFSISIA